MKREDLTGKKFNKLFVLNFLDRKGKNLRWNCKCDCGNLCIANSGNLKNGHSKSCGCYKIQQTIIAKTVHGKHNLPEYSIWKGIKKRCTNPNEPAYKNYGGRGITMCDEWVESFETFYKDVGSRPSSIYSLDRKDNDLGYYKENCRWATDLEQANNTRCNIKVINIITNEEYPSITEAARKIGMNQATLRMQLRGKNQNKTNLKIKFQ